MKSLKDRLVVITGAGSGIGRALAQEAVRRGARVAISDVDEAGLAETADQLPAERCHAAVLDVARRGDWQRYRRRLLAEAGPPDVLINNAGVAVAQRVEHLSMDDFRWLMEINFWGVVHGCQTFLPDLRARPQAAIVNVSSVFGLIGVPTQGAYCASKFAVRGLTESLRAELAGSTVQVMCVHPGGVRTAIARRARIHAAPGGHDPATAAERFEQIARTSPEAAARRILDDLQARRPRSLIGADARLIDWAQRLMPAAYTRLLNRLLELA